MKRKISEKSAERLTIPMTVLAIVLSLMVGCKTSGYEHAERGSYQFQMGDYEQAAKEFKMAARFLSKDADVWYALGLSYAHQGLFEPSNDAFNRLIQLDATYKRKIITAYQVLIEKTREEQPATAVLALKQIGALDAGFEFGVDAYLLGFSYFDDGHFAQAHRYLKQAIKVDPAHRRVEDARVKIAFCLKKEGDVINSFLSFLVVDYNQLSQMERADFFFQFGETAYQYAEQSYHATDYMTALSALNTYLEIGQPTTLIDDAYYLQGDVLQRLGSIQNAAISYEKVLQLNPYQRGQLYHMAETAIRQIRLGQSAPIDTIRIRDISPEGIQF